MQSYTVYKVSEFLKDRHPYQRNENDNKFKLNDPEQVSVAYNERAVPKLSNLLTYRDLNSSKRRDALVTLNELVSHQEAKVEMLDNKIVLSASNLMADDSWEVRSESAKLVGGLLFLDIGREQFNSRPGNFELMQSLIFDPSLQVRESVGWLLHRLALHKDGVQMITDSGTLTKMVEAFKHYAQSNRIEESHKYILYLIESFVHISMYDFGITHMLKKNLLHVFNAILTNNNNDYSSVLSKGMFEQLQELVLNTFKNITLIKPGKEEAIKEGLIYTMLKFLDSSKENERLFSSSFIMSIANNLEGKKQVSGYQVDDKFVLLEVRIVY